MIYNSRKKRRKLRLKRAFQLKRKLDVIGSIVGIVLLFPVWLFIAFLIKLTSPGPIFFLQDRPGYKKKIFRIYKFRTMRQGSEKMEKGVEVLKDDARITKIGGFLRRTKLDETPQLLNVLKGEMSLVGPRPERVASLADYTPFIAKRLDMKPGMTGLAQVSGNIYLDLQDRYRLDVYYVEHFSLLLDIRILIRTIGVVFFGEERYKGKNLIKTMPMKRKHKNKIVGEGKNTERLPGIKPVKGSDAGFEDYGYKKSFSIDRADHKNVLITGANSYIGESLQSYAEIHYPNLSINTIDMMDRSWREFDFSPYDAVFHVAGIAHADIGSVGDEEKARYYAVNRDLAIETAKIAKESGVKQFIFMSSIIVYGDSAPYGKKKVIDESTIPSPANFYGDSKWQADQGVRKLGDDRFHVAVLRPPMIYGRGSKGNYPVLAKLAKRLPVFPDVNNQRSMLYIDNLCELLCLLILSGEGGVYFPQNKQYSDTSELVRMIALAGGKKVHTTRILNGVVALASHMPGKIGDMADKAFGSFVYSQNLSEYCGMEYRVNTLEESIKKTEDIYCTDGCKQSVLILVNHDVVIYNFRLELVERLLSDGYDVHISSPYGERIDDLVALGAKYHEISIDRHGMNPAADFLILKEYRKLIKLIQPIVVLTYTIKPNIYGGIAAKEAGIPFIANITGLGTSIENEGLKKYFILQLYKAGLHGAYKIYFQNRENLKFMVRHGIVSSPYDLLPGSGVNLIQHCYEKYPEDTEELIFVTIGRIMEDKGIDELLVAAKAIKQRYPKVRFRIIGFFDGNYKDVIKIAVKKGIVEYIEQQKEIHSFMVEAHAIIHPSHHEGMSNVLLEAAATGRPILASDIPGCRETFDEGISGMGFETRNCRNLICVIEQFIKLPYEKKVEMGKTGRKKMEREFDRQIVVNKYIQEINGISGLHLRN